LSSPVAAVSGGEDRIDIFGLDVSNRMVHRAWAEDQFVPINSWEFLQGGRFNSAPAVVTSPPFAIDLFALSNTNTMHHNYSFGSGAWVTPDPVNWHEIKQNFFSSPPAAAFSGGRIHVVALGQDNRFLYNSGKPADPNSWGNWKSLLKVMLSPLAIVPGVRPAGTGVRPTIVIFGLDESNRMWFWEGAGTETDPNEIAGNWHQLPGLICSSPPAVVSVGTSRIDVFVLDTSNRMRHQARIGVSGEFPNIWDLLGGDIQQSSCSCIQGPR
jgi:hypothetical protein